MDDQISSSTDDEKLPSDQFTDCKNFDLEDILDLAGGAKDAIERHRSEDTTMDIKTEKILEKQEAKAPLSQ
ncbi:reticulon-4a isoform X1, partial [Tachysurus ichikawai]